MSLNADIVCDGGSELRALVLVTKLLMEIELGRVVDLVVAERRRLDVRLVCRPPALLVKLLFTPVGKTGGLRVRVP
jgi:hypothetical protein